VNDDSPMLTRIACLLLFLLLPSLALATDLQVTDIQGTMVVVKNATVDYGSLLSSDPEKEGIRVQQGDAIVRLKWSEVQSVSVTKVDTSVKPGTGDRYLLELVKGTTQPAILVLNKVDLVAKNKLLPLIDHYRQAHPFVEIVPASAVDGTNVDLLETLFLRYLPEGEPLYPPDYLTDQTERFFVAEIVREQVLQLTHDELPFSTAVVVDKFDEAADEGKRVDLYCTILVDRESQKPIVIGKGGSMIKQIGTAARVELEDYLEKHVYLDLHVKVKSEWRDDERLLEEIRAQNREP